VNVLGAMTTTRSRWATTSVAVRTTTPNIDDVVVGGGLWVVVVSVGCATAARTTIALRTIRIAGCTGCGVSQLKLSTGDRPMANKEEGGSVCTYHTRTMRSVRRIAVSGGGRWSMASTRYDSVPIHRLSSRSSVSTAAGREKN